MNTYKLLKIVAVVFAVIIVVLLGVLIFVKPAQGPSQASAPLTASLGAGAGSVATGTAPAVSPDGRVVVIAPLPGAAVRSPATISGTVTGGGWFFEAVFPVKILDGDGTVLGAGEARAQGDWTATGTVIFTAVIPFAAPRAAAGTIVLAKDNPSGAPANAEQFSVPVGFSR